MQLYSQEAEKQALRENSRKSGILKKNYKHSVKTRHFTVHRLGKLNTCNFKLPTFQEKEIRIRIEEKKRGGKKEKRKI